ncbi:RNA polymerase III transcription factor (TF)IIIC subunit [Pseudoloma neurophilia]|uniref:RNA polymerase III transcription factor (TF)IIIC subunit n=1 Tax=Pseudoloma neurophilia TaxID=146866 RepID=A0A0R0M777_9MICR|nr:RNA polymerase III transcription factor (TF)IIIC subunit [Pseudoloma neurophilia]
MNTDEPESFDLLKIPYKIEQTDNIEPFRSENHYELRFHQKLDGKKLISDEHDSSKNYLLIENEQITGISKEVFEFNSPYDFIIEQNSDAYEIFFKRMCEEGSENVSYEVLLSENTVFNPYAPPILSHNQLFENYDFKNLKNENRAKKNLKLDQKLSNKEMNELKTILKEAHGSEEFDLLYDKFEKVFSEKKIVRWKDITFHHEKIGKYQIKRYLPFFATFRSSGPWRKTWIKHDFDPKSDQNSFKMQKVSLNRKGKEICLNDNPFLIHELEQNKNKYLKKNANGTGFLTEDALDLINLHFDRSIVPDVAVGFPSPNVDTFVDESSEASDFSLIDE